MGKFWHPNAFPGYISKITLSKVQGRRDRGARVPMAPSKVSQNQYSGGLSNAPASGGILALPPPNIFTFRRPWCKWPSVSHLLFKFSDVNSDRKLYHYLKNMSFNPMFSSISIVSMLKFGLKLKSLKEGFESALAMSFHCLLPHKKPEDKGQFVAVGCPLLLPSRCPISSSTQTSKNTTTCA